jgi:hypothetical protein
MSVPNRFIVVDRVFQESGPWDLTTHDGCGLFLEAVARLLHQEDPDFGHLRKHAPQNLYNGHAVDNVLYKPTGQAVDIIIESATDKARIAWQEDIPRYSDADWYAPDDWHAPPVPAPVDPPPPAPPVEPPAPELVLAALARIEAAQVALAAQSDRNTEQIQQQIDALSTDAQETFARYLPFFEAVLRMGRS